MSLYLGIEGNECKHGDTSHVFAFNLFDDEAEMYLTDDYSESDFDIRIADVNGNYIKSVPTDHITISDDDTISILGDSIVNLDPGVYQVEIDLANEDDTKSIFPTGTRPVIRVNPSI